MRSGMGEVSNVNGAFQEVPAGAAFSPQKKARISSACVRTKAVATASHHADQMKKGQGSYLRWLKTLY